MLARAALRHGPQVPPAGRARGSRDYREPPNDRSQMKDIDESKRIARDFVELRRENARLQSRLAELSSTVEFFRASEGRFKYMIDQMGDGIAIVDLDERFIFCNPSAERLFEVRTGELVGKNLREFLSSEQFSKIRHETRLRRDRLRSSYEVEISASDGAKKILSVSAVPWADARQKVCGTFATFRDITPQRRAEESLQLQRDRIRKYLDIAGVILVAVGADHRVTMINRKGCEVIGLGDLEIVGKDWFECFIPERMRGKVVSVFDELTAGDRAPVEYFENPVLTASGEERLVAWHNTLLVDEGGTVIGTLSSGEDITDRKLTEEKLLGLERMRAMAQMTAGISHNLNNILVGVTAHCQLLQKASEDPEVLKEASAIMKSAKRAVNLVRRLEWAVLGRDEEIEPVSLNAQVLEAVREIRGYCGDSSDLGNRPIEILTALDEVPVVRGTSSGMHDVLVNVLLNAVDAMPTGGTIRVTSRTAGDSVSLAVRDDGEGMDEHTRRRVFEPFFTTKARVGMGLGMSTAYGAVTSWGGRIEVDSRLGRGTTFTLFFKKWAGDAHAAKGCASERAAEADPEPVPEPGGPCEAIS
jgi:PAS domain S-box-containing protein